MTLSHFSAVLICAACIGIVFGITQRAEPKMMIRFGAYTFVVLVAVTIAASWGMWLIKH
ncbi:MAG TPA: hypothetical protein VN678_00420 [Acidobacteriaceae bacterium]|nr:hypothetical protein [Acidobacteriaceae bacterium]HXE06645.1 hypothetical protein [Acidobacteriaceae bacterium]